MLWDSKKRQLMQRYPQLVTYIKAPIQYIDADSCTGVISEDGIHPSSKGYRYWAVHVAREIALSRATKFTAGVHVC
jgi:lysophospholipase L1-like esterase